MNVGNRMRKTWPHKRLGTCHNLASDALDSDALIDDLTMSLLLTPIIQIFNYTLQPIAPFTWFNISLSTLDVVAAFRLCIVLRQIKESLYRQHVSKNGIETVAPKAFARDISTTLTVVYGGEASGSRYFSGSV